MRDVRTINAIPRGPLVRLKVVGDEVVRLAGKTISTLRVEPTLHYRLPLIIAFKTDFGFFRAELQSYRAN